jgi:peptidyl-prolyl cis-trans isomerase A (cyclophilin A)
VTDTSPDRYSVKLVTTQGDVIIDIDRMLAPKGADRFYELVTSGYFTDIACFRVVPGFVVQAGLHGDPATNKLWRDRRIQDDPVKSTNAPGTVCFATSGPNARTTQFFISLRNNGRLDAMGFAPFGQVRSLEVVEKLYSGYGEGPPNGNGPQQSRVQREGNAYLKAEFPLLDYIKRAELV